MDLISRQALRDAMYHEAFETDTEMQRWDSGCWIRYKLFENIIDNLPSAEPNLQPTCNQLATDCISRQDAIDAVNELTKWYYETYHEKRPTAIAVIDKLMDLPSAEPEIIRCKDCKHMIINEKHEAKPMICCFTKMCGTTEPDWFCADGERRDDK